MKLKNAFIPLAALTLSLVFFLRALDAAVEIDSLKSHIKSQKETIEFLQSVNGQAIAGCAVKVDAFEDIVKKSSYASNNQWVNNRIFVGPFLAEKTNDCVSRVDLIALPK